VIDTGRSIAAVAVEINVSEQSLGKWVRAEKAVLGPAGEPALVERVSGRSWSVCVRRMPC